MARMHRWDVWSAEEAPRKVRLPGVRRKPGTPLGGKAVSLGAESNRGAFRCIVDLLGDGAPDLHGDRCVLD